MLPIDRIVGGHQAFGLANELLFALGPQGEGQRRSEHGQERGQRERQEPRPLPQWCAFIHQVVPPRFLSPDQPPRLLLVGRHTERAEAAERMLRHAHPRRCLLLRLGECETNRLGRMRTPRRVLLEKLANERVQPDRTIERDGARPRRHRVELLLVQGLRRGRNKRRPAREHVKQHASERIEISLVRQVRLAAKLLGRQIAPAG